MNCVAVCARAQSNTGATVTIDRSTAEACTDAFDEAQASRKVIGDLRAENKSLNDNLNLANRLADSESKRADSEQKRADAEHDRAEALQVALDASKKETAAANEQTRIRTEERDFWKGKYKSERKGKFLAIGGLIIAVGSRIFF